MPGKSLKQQPRPKPRPAPRAQDIRTGTPDPHRGFTKYPYEYDHLVSGNKLSGLLQANLVYLIGRNTWGKQERPEWAKLSLTALAKLAGSVERKSVAIALRDLAARGIIEARDRKGCSPTQAKMYKLAPQNWRKAAAYEPPSPEEEAAAEVEAAANDPEETASPDAQESSERTVAPGRISRPTPVAIAFKGAQEPITISVVYYSQVDEPLTFRSRPAANGRLQVTVSRPTGEGKAKRCSSPQPQSFATHSPTAEENERVRKYSTCVSSLVLDNWRKAADDQLISAILRKSGNAPVEVFANLARLKLAKKGHTHTPGLLLQLAEDAAKAFSAMQQQDAREARPAPTKTTTGPAPLDPTRRWDRIRAAVQSRISPIVYDNWFAYSEQGEERADSTVVIVSSPDHARFMTEEFSELIAAAAIDLGEPTKILWRVAE